VEPTTGYRRAAMKKFREEGKLSVIEREGGESQNLAMRKRKPEEQEKEGFEGEN